MLRSFVKHLVAVLLAALIGAAPAQPSDAEATHVLLILDASGSMYLRLDDGEYRITAAKEALTAFVSRLPEAADLNVGLRVYGARVDALAEDACLDSVLDVPVEGFDRELLLRTIRDTQARGATPIAYSLELAVEDLREAEGRKVVVLVTDGAESCGGDVRGAVERLSAAGLEVDIHIIGFALSPADARSFEGLGTYQDTASAIELATALGRAVEVTPVTVTYPVTVTLTRQGEPAVDGASVRFVDGVSGDAIPFDARGEGVFEAALPAGSYRAEVADAFAAQPLTVAGLAVADGAENAFSFELEAAAEVVIAVEPDEPLAGSEVRVRFENAPAGERNWLAIAPADAGDAVYVSWAYVQDEAGEVDLRVPDQPGALEVRYHLSLPEGGTRVIGRSPVFTSRVASATLEAPAEVAAGSAFEVAWSGPDNARDYLTIVPVGAAEGSYQSYAYTDRGSPGTLTAPIEPGAYEVRYVTGQASATLASLPVVVSPVSVSLQVPAQVPIGATFAVTWLGPDNAGDYVTVVAEGAREGAYMSYAYTSRGSPAALTAPIDAGRYEVRYVAGQGNATLASVPLVVTAVATSLEAPAEVAGGSTFAVAWSGPDASGDYVTIVEEGAREGAYMSYAYTRRGSPVELSAPIDAGRYEVRYVAGQGSATLASAPVVVTAVAVRLEAPAEVAAGEAFEVVWSGPDASGDYVTIVAEGAREGAYLSYAYTRRGSPVRITAPSEPGRYEVRYVAGQGNRTLGSIPIVVR